MTSHEMLDDQNPMFNDLSARLLTEHCTLNIDIERELFYV